MMTVSMKVGPDHTAARTALWRALHAQIDTKPLVFTDEIGARILNEANWQNRPDMDPQFSKPMRASIVGRARFVEDLVEDCSLAGVGQYVILGAGLDTFMLRRPDLAQKIKVFELDQPGPQAWKRRRLDELGYSACALPFFIPVDFERGELWWEELVKGGFDRASPAVVVSTGVSMYLSQEANFETLRHIARMAPGSTMAMTFMLTLDLLEPQERSVMEYVMKKAAESGTPFVSLWSPDQAILLAKDAGFKVANYVSAEDLYKKYFAGRTDGLRAGHAEAFLVAST